MEFLKFILEIHDEYIFEPLVPYIKPFVYVFIIYGVILLLPYIPQKRTFALDFNRNVDDMWFEQICLGNQTILGVVGDKARFHQLQKWVGYNCCLYNKNCRIQKALINVVYYDRLGTFISASGYKKCAPQTASQQEAFDLYQSTNEIKHMYERSGEVCGIIGLEFY